MSETRITDCIHCGTKLQGSICHNCGQKQIIQRWSLSKISGQFLSQITNIEKGFLFTLRVLFTAPDRLIDNYWRGNTIAYYNPFRYVIIWTAVNIFINFWLGIDDILQANLTPDSIESQLDAQQIESGDQGLDKWLNVLVLFLIPVNAGTNFLLFRKARKNYAEHLVMICFVMGQTAFISTFSHFFLYAFPTLVTSFLILNFLIGWIYNSYVFKLVFKEHWGLIVLKALLFGIVGMVAYFAMVAAVSTVAIVLA